MLILIDVKFWIIIKILLYLDLIYIIQGILLYGGEIIYLSDNLVKIKKDNFNSIYHINIFDNHTGTLLKLQDKILFSFIDTRNDNYNLNTFTSTIKSQQHIFREAELIIKKIERKYSFIKPIINSIIKSDKFLTMDLDTRKINAVLSPYAVCIFDGK